MARPRPDPHPRARGFLGAWVSGAMMWSSTTKRLLKAGEPGEAILAMVALYLCIKETCLLIEGRPDVPLDDEARADCPVDPRELRKLRDRLQGFRDEILHFADKADEGRELRTKWSADPPHFTYESSVGRDQVGWDSISRPEIEELLAKLDPWLHRHWERLVHEDDGVDAAALNAKMDAFVATLVRFESNREATPDA